MRVSVPQPSGEIAVSYNGDPPDVYEVVDGEVEVGPHHLAAFLAAVPGAAPVLDAVPTADPPLAVVEPLPDSDAGDPSQDA